MQIADATLATFGDQYLLIVLGNSVTVDVGGTLPGSNTAPTVGDGDLAGSVTEGGTVSLENTDLNANDTEQPGPEGRPGLRASQRHPVPRHQQ